MVQVDLGDMENEVRSAEESAKKALADSQRLTEDLRRQQDVAASSEKQRRTIEVQVSPSNITHPTTTTSSSSSSVAKPAVGIIDTSWVFSIFFFFWGITVMPILTAHNWTTVPARPKLTMEH